MRFRVAYLVSHPIQYQAPLLQRLASHPEISLHVFYMELPKGRSDPEFGIPIQWDIPLLEGYPWSRLCNVSPFRRTSGFLRFVHPGIVSALMRGRYDALIVHGYAHCTEWIAFVTAWARKIPLLLRGESTLLRRPPWWLDFVKSLLLGMLFRKAAALLAIGRLNREFYRSYGAPEDRIFFVPYAVDNDRFFSDVGRLTGARRALRQRWGWPEDLPVVLYVGKLIPRKRPMDLLDAYARVIREAPAGLVYVGEGSERKRLLDVARAQGLRWVAVTGFLNQTEISRCYAAADLLVLPSSHEPWGLVLNEAMCFGLPLIASSAVGAAPDLVKQGENGVVYPVGDVSELAKALRLLLTDPQLRKRMGQRSREIVSRYSYEADIRGILEALHSVCAARRRPPVNWVESATS